MPHAHHSRVACCVCYVQDRIVVVVYHENLPRQVEMAAGLPRKDAVGDIGAVCQQRGEQQAGCKHERIIPNI